MIDFVKKKLFALKNRKFFKVIGIAIEKGYREVYFAKWQGMMYNRNRIYFNMQAIYEYADGQWICIATFKDNLKKIKKVLEV